MKGHIRERSPGHWAIIIDVRDPATGKRRRKWHSFKGTKRQAQVESARLISDLTKGVYQEPHKTKLSEYLDRWLTHMRSQVSPRSHERYDEICRKNIIPLLGGVALTRLQSITISTAWTKALETGHRGTGGPLSPRTVGHMHMVLKNALGQAVRWRLLTFNPAADVKPPRVEPKLMLTYDLEQTALLVEGTRDNRIFPAIVLAALCGLRRGETVALRWRDVDLNAATLVVAGSLEQTKKAVRYKPPKNGKGRAVSLSETAVEELRGHKVRQAQKLLRLGIRQTPDTYVCTMEDGSLMRPNTLTIYWSDLVGKLELPRIRFHDLRHACATHMLKLGVHPKIAAEKLGHSRVAVTLDLYSHVMPGMQEEATEKVDAEFRKAMQAAKKK